MVSETSTNLLVIGKQYPDKQANIIVTGKLEYSADMLTGKKLFTRTLASPYAHANIKNIDITKAMALEGVKAITTYQDCPIMSSELLFWGDRVAAVAATDTNIADQALLLIDVNYEVLPYVVNPDLAIGATLPPPGQTVTVPPITVPSSGEVGIPPVYVNPVSTVNRGDIQAGFSQADVVVESDVGWTSNYQHGSIEPRATTVYWVTDDLYVWTSSQNPFGYRSQVASALNIPLNKIHLISHGTGNGHGDKNWADEVTIAAVLSKKAGMPVCNFLSRFENFLQATHQYGVKGHVKVGCKNDGTLTALSGQFLCDTPNALAPQGGDVISSITQNYKCANLTASSDSISTNKGHACWWRSVGEPMGNIIFEQVIDMAAEKAGMDPLSFRLKNAVTEPIDQDSGRPWGSVAIKECLQQAGDAIGFSDKWHQPGTKTLADGRMHGIGISGIVCSKGTLAGRCGAIVNVNRDGTVLLDVGISRAGCGTNSAMCFIVAETLGMTLDKVNTGDWGNTDVASDGGFQAGSTRTITLGAAYTVAARDAKSQLFDVAAGMLNVTSDQLDAANNNIFVASSPSQSVSIADVAAKAPGPIIGRGIGWPSELRLKPQAGQPIGTPAGVKTSAASAAEVAVDLETGVIEVLNFVIADDMGRAINSIGVRNQLEGGLEVMQGEALFYEQVWSQNNGGACLGYDYLHQPFPTTSDFNLDNHQHIVVEPIDSVGPYGAKGLGEPPITTYSSIHHAVYNAIGKWISEPPFSQWKVLKALGKI
jgi:xanthine dehydrogenase molybdenum-binding subunit